MEASVFKTFARALYVAKVHELRSDGPASHLNSTIVQGFQSSLKRLAPLCQSVPELEYLALMQRIATTAASNSIAGGS